MRFSSFVALALVVFAVVVGCGGEEESVTVPYLVGLKEPLAFNVAADEGFEVEVQRGPSTAGPKGFVYMQRPREGTTLSDGAKLTIWVASN
ncbi:MAG: PASTA domain-containing protein [Actinobacteria bacterium]|nr:PASTA domain-containing protein [Actinomycetota bacterium]